MVARIGDTRISRTVLEPHAADVRCVHGQPVAPVGRGRKPAVSPSAAA